MKILTGNANPELAAAIAKDLGVALTTVNMKRFADQEVFVEIMENVRGEDVFLIQPTCPPANDTLMELLVALDALKRASAKRVTAVVPYFGYARQDRKPGPRTPISARLVADLIETAGAHRVLTMDLHAGQIQGFFNIPTDNLYGQPVMVRDIEEKYEDTEKLMIVSPDVGGVVRARALAKRLGADLAIVDKRREKAGVSEVMNVIGDVSDRHCILIDDIADSAGTLCNAANALIEQGALSVAAYVSHGVLSGEACTRIQASKITDFVATDSIPARPGMEACTKLRRVSIAPLMAEAIRRINNEASVSSLFD